MKVSFVSWAGRETASSRLRAFVLSEALNEVRGVGSRVWLTQGTDVVVAQKLSDPRDLEAISMLGSRLKVYDFDDRMRGEVMARAHEVCDAFTTDTEGHKRWYLAQGWTKPCHVVPDCVDYVREPMPPVYPSNSAAWFGNKENVGPALLMGVELYLAGIKVGMISNFRRAPGGAFEVMPWRLESLPADLRGFGTCFLTHDGQDEGKSNNKMTAALSIGLPCIVEGGCCYEELAMELGMDELVAKGSWTAADAFKAAENRDYRMNAMHQAQAIVWGRYSPAAVAEVWLEAVREELG